MIEELKNLGTEVDSYDMLYQDKNRRTQRRNNKYKDRAKRPTGPRICMKDYERLSPVELLSIVNSYNIKQLDELDL